MRVELVCSSFEAERIDSVVVVTVTVIAAGRLGAIAQKRLRKIDGRWAQRLMARGVAV